MIKLIITDIDETIVPESSINLNPEYIEVIRKFQEKGAMFVAASGRHRHSVLEVFSDLEEFGVLGNNGTDIHCFDYIDAMEFDRQDYLDLIDDLYQLPEDYSVMACNADYTYIDEKHKEFYDRMSNLYKFKCTLTPSLYDVENICKISAFNKNGFDDTLAKQLAEKWGAKLEANKVGEYFFDFMQKGSNKGKALSLVQKHFGITPEETVAFGDSNNDSSMFEHAKYSYAVANASPALKALASEVIGPMSEDAVLKKLKELLKTME